jgi:signal transduction histidine kinase
VVSAIAASCSGLAGVIGLLVVPALRRRSVRVAFAAVALLSTVAFLAGVVGAGAAMFLSGYDVMVVAVAAAVAAPVTLGVATLLARQVVGGSAALRAAVRDLSRDGSFVAPSAPATAELAALSAELTEAVAALDASRRRERELVAWVSHDLRSPLASLRVMAEALEDGMVADPSRYHKEIRLQTDRLAGMVDDLFELARIDAGDAVLAATPLSLPDLVSDALASADPVAAANGVRLTGRAAALPGQLCGDIRGLSRVVANLVTNAIQHTPAGGTVTVEVYGDGDLAALTVSDGCGGIPEHDLPRVFDVAWRGTPARTPAGENGSGLGLAIVRGLVHAHHGTVTVHNADAGCRFEVRLPVGIA